MKSKFSLFVSVCLLPTCLALTTPAFGASLADLAGTWNLNEIATGPDEPWWGRDTITVQPNGKFNGSDVESDGTNTTITGTFSLSSGGFQVSGPHINKTTLCQMDLGKTILVCTSTSKNGSTNLIIGVKQADPYSEDDIAGDWEGNALDGGPTNPSWMRYSSESMDINGNFQGSYSDSNGNSTALSGQLAFSTADGQVTCLSGCPDSNWISFMDASKTVVVGTLGVDAQVPDAVLTVFTKMAPSGSYSTNDPVGTWQMNTLASGADAPWWERATVTFNSNGTFNFSGTENGSSKVDKGTGTFSISSDGVMTIPSFAGQPFRAVMNENKTVMAFTNTWSDGSTQIGVFTKSAGLPGAPTGVSATPGNAQAKVSFTAPASNGGSSITDYTVTSSPDATHPNGVTAKGATSPITVNGLSNGTPYTFTVTATNNIGTGPASSSSSPVTPAAKPSAPTIGAITAGAGQATVNFTEKSDGGSPTTYTVTTNPKGGVDTNAASTSLSHLITNLKSGTKYTFTVTATNAIGSSSSTSKPVTIE